MQACARVLRSYLRSWGCPIWLLVIRIHRQRLGSALFWFIGKTLGRRCMFSSAWKQYEPFCFSDVFSQEIGDEMPSATETSLLIIAFFSSWEERSFSEENRFLLTSLCLPVFMSQLFFPSSRLTFGKENLSRQSLPQCSYFVIYIYLFLFLLSGPLRSMKWDFFPLLFIFSIRHPECSGTQQECTHMQIFLLNK